MKKVLVCTVVVVTAVLAMPAAEAGDPGYSGAVRNADLWIVNPFNPTEEGQLTYKFAENDFDGLPAWAPDPHYIAFNSFKSQAEGGTGMNIYVANFETKAIHQFTNNEHCNCGPAWSPDGQLLAFHGVTTNPQGTWEGIHVFSIQPDGTGKEATYPVSTKAFLPTWSPDSKRIAYVTENPDGYSISVLDYVGVADGVSYKTYPDIAKGDFPAWSPFFTDGSSRIAFSGNDHNLYLMDPANGQVSQLTNSGQDLDPTWSPDGSMLAFASYRDGNAEIYVMSADGSNQRRITGNPGFDGYPSWSPMGKGTINETRVVYSSDRPGEPPPTAANISEYRAYGVLGCPTLGRHKP
jgi:Tol biopolymer transport system component